MESMNEEQLESLLYESAHRHETVKEIQENVMKAVGRERRRERTRKGIRLLTFCFGVPLLLLLPATVFFFAPFHEPSIVTIAMGVSLLFFYVPVIYRLNHILNQPFI